MAAAATSPGSGRGAYASFGEFDFEITYDAARRMYDFHCLDTDEYVQGFRTQNLAIAAAESYALALELEGVQ